MILSSCMGVALMLPVVLVAPHTYDFMRHAKCCAARKFLTSYLGVANHVPILTEAISHITFFYSVEGPSLVKLLFRYPEVNFSNYPHVTSAPGCFPATWEPQTLFVLHQCTKQRSLALKSSLPQAAAHYMCSSGPPGYKKVEVGPKTTPKRSSCVMSRVVTSWEARGC